jgi:hypothetical protein
MLECRGMDDGVRAERDIGARRFHTGSAGCFVFATEMPGFLAAGAGISEKLDLRRAVDAVADHEGGQGEAEYLRGAGQQGQKRRQATAVYDPGRHALLFLRSSS